VRQGLHVIDLHRPGGVEVAQSREIGPLAVLQGADQLGDHEIEIGIALAMRMGTHVDRLVVERDIDIGAMVEIEAAQEILVGLALAAMLGDYQPRHDLERFAHAIDGLLLDLLTGDDPLRGGVRREKRPVRRRGQAQFRQCDCGTAGGAISGGSAEIFGKW